MKGRIFGRLTDRIVDACWEGIRNAAAVLVIVDYTRITDLWEKPGLPKYPEIECKENTTTFGDSPDHSGLDGI